jgi:hypothetical protein
MGFTTYPEATELLITADGGGSNGTRARLWKVSVQQLADELGLKIMATGLELAMLLTPYPQFFAIPLTALFVAVTFTAHLVFGVALGLVTKWWARRWKLAVARH